MKEENVSKTPLELVDYLHDAAVNEIRLEFDEDGTRRFRLRMQCDSDCGYHEWNGRKIEVCFLDPVVILADLFGHMTNADSFDSWRQAQPPRMSGQIGRLREAGLGIPRHVVELVFHSGSVIEVACNAIQFDIS